MLASSWSTDTPNAGLISVMARVKSSIMMLTLPMSGAPYVHVQALKLLVYEALY